MNLKLEISTPKLAELQVQTFINKNLRTAANEPTPVSKERAEQEVIYPINI